MSNANNLTDPGILMHLAKDGDPDAFGQLYTLYFTPVFRYIYARVSNKDDANDLAQVVFLKAYQSITRFHDQNKPPLAYFFTISRNSVIDYWRKKKDIPFSDIENTIIGLPDTAQSPHDAAEKKSMAQTIHQTLLQLTDEQQEVIVMRFINEMSNKEIAELLGKTEEAIRQLQCRAIKSLRQKLKNRLI